MAGDRLRYCILDDICTADSISRELNVICFLKSVQMYASARAVCECCVSCVCMCVFVCVCVPLCVRVCVAVHVRVWVLIL